MDFIWESITDWLKEILVSGVISNLTGMFDSTNQQVGDIISQVGMTPQGWNSGIFHMIQNLSSTVILPIAGAILAIVMTLELIQLITDKNNLNDVDTWMFFKWVFKSAAAVLIVTHTWDIVMGIFEASQSVVSNAAGVIVGDTSIDISSVMSGLESRLMEMDIGPLFGLWVQSLLVGFCSWAIAICIFIVIYGRMIEVYLVTSVAPIPMATMVNREWGQMGQNYLRALFALGFQAFLIIIDYDAPVSEDLEQFSTYFLNKVDDADLKAILEDGEVVEVCGCIDKCYAGHVNVTCPICAKNMTECVGLEPEPTEEPTAHVTEPQEEPKKESGASGVLVFLLILGLGGGAGWYFFRDKLTDKKTDGDTDLDEYDYGMEDEEDYADLEEKSVRCQVQAVYSSFLDPEMLEGRLFADTTNMPYLLLNEAAAKSFSESEDKSGIAVSTEVIMSRGGAETKCVICGIFRDGASTPKAYMSYDVASKLFSDEISGTELIFMTKNKGKAEAVAAGLLRNHISAEVDSNVMLAWELLEQQAWQTVLISTLLVVCATNAYLGSNHQDFQGCWIEKIILLTSGLTRREVFYVSLAKNSMTAGIAFCGAGMLAVVFGDFSWQGILCVACIGIAFCVTCSVKYYMSSMEDRDGDT